MDVVLMLPGHGEPICHHRAMIDERFAPNRRRADKLHRPIAERRKPPPDWPKHYGGTSP
jgi:hypothetical protein